MKKNIVFDIDRTIVDSHDAEILSLQKAIEIVMGKKAFNEELNKLMTLPTKEFFNALQLTEREISLINQEWEKIFQEYQIHCFKGIKSLIRILYESDYTISIVTSRVMDEFHELDNELSDIMYCFQEIVTSDMVNSSKPDKESMEYLCNRLNCNPSDIIYIGDSKIDKDFASNAGCSFIPAVWENKELSEEEMACFSPLDLLESINLVNGLISRIYY